jgi:calpain, invertebrate
MYMHSRENNEFWSALMEKAYAKLNGCYENLSGGLTAEALVDFTGGIVETFDLNDPPKKLFHILSKGFKRNSMIGCSLNKISNVTEEKTADGLVRGHAYSVTKASMFDIVLPTKTGQIPLLRVRNPWGDDAEWNGPWSDNSFEWKSMNEESRNIIGLNFDSDGEFWMEFTDFLKHFDRLEICNLGPESLIADKGNQPRHDWSLDMFEGSWVKGISAAGCPNKPNQFHRNPQYMITLETPDADDEDGKCTVVVSLVQKNRRARRIVGEQSKNLSIGFMMYHVKDKYLNQKPQTAEFFKYNYPIEGTPQYCNIRGMNCRLHLAPGNYLIVPSTFYPNEEGEFIVRVFSEGKHLFKENDGSVGMGEIDSRVSLVEE